MKGFEVDRLDDNLVAIRSIPSFLELFQSSEFFSVFFEAINEIAPKKVWLDKLSPKLANFPIELTPHQIEELIYNFSTTQLLQDGILHELDERTLHSLLK